jgi:iron(III) transport system ATP-binding protein
VLDQGVLQQVGTPATLYDEPVNAFVATFVGTMNLLPARVLQRTGAAPTLQVDGLGPLPLPAGSALPPQQEVLLSVRPQAVQIRRAGAADQSDAPALSGTVQSREFLGEFTRYRVRVGPHDLVADQVHHAGQPALAAGDAVGVTVDPSQLRLLAR